MISVLAHISQVKRTWEILETLMSAIAYCSPPSTESFVQFRKHNKDPFATLFHLTMKLN